MISLRFSRRYAQLDSPYDFYLVGHEAIPYSVGPLKAVEGEQHVQNL